MQSERRAIRAFRLSGAKTRRRAGEFFDEFISLKKRNGLFGDADNENKMRWNNSIFLAGRNKITAETQRHRVIHMAF
jgi:hypothetical protein